MKKIIAALLLLVSLAAVCSGAPTRRQLDGCEVLVYDYGALKLHAFATNDVLNDECFLVEGPDSIAAIEMPQMTDSLREWREYVAKLDKPLSDVFICAHPGSSAIFKDARVMMTKGALLAVSNDVWVNARARSGVTGWANDKPQPTEIIRSGEVRAAGTVFEITETGRTYRIAIPAINAVYTHIFGADTHSIFLSIGDIDSMIGEARDFLADGYTLILSAHHEPEGRSSVRSRINTLESIKDILLTSEDSDEYRERMREAFPDMKGEHLLDLSAAYMFAPRHYRLPEEP